APDDHLRNQFSGSAYAFSRPGAGQDWSFERQLFSADGRTSQKFGFSVAVAGDTVLVGAYGDADATGAAYVFVRGPELSEDGEARRVWFAEAKLEPDKGARTDWFGVSVALSGNGNLALIGAEQ